MDPISRELIYYAPALALESVISRRNLGRLSKLGFAATTLCGSTAVATYYLEYPQTDILLGSTLLLSAGYFSILLLRLFINSFYFRGFHSLISNAEPTARLTYEVARIFTDAHGDVAYSFTQRPQGYRLLRRLGLSNEAITAWLNSDRPHLSHRDLDLPPTGCITFKDLAVQLYHHDSTLAQRIAQTGTTETSFTQTVEWVTREYYQFKQMQRWWARDNLIAYGSIGSDWTYGLSYTLKRFTRPLRSQSIFSSLILDDPYATDKVVEIEGILSRNREAHALVVGKAGVGKLDILAQIGERITRHESTPQLQQYQLITLETERLLAQFSSGPALEQACVQLFDQAAHTGNTILILNNLPTFLQAAANLGVDLLPLLESYLSVTGLHFVFTSDPQSYHQLLEPTALMRSLQVVLVEPPSLAGVERLLSTVVRSYEQQHQVIFTYTALQAIARDAERYISTGVMPDKAFDLLGEVASVAGTAGSDTVTAEFVDNYVHQKTGVPIGNIDDAERDILLHLEDKLHEHVIGQNAAITAISKAMRRARTGVQSAERPLGSFLFLGPTGVGKTETAKALAHIFFGAETAMQRFDMSEYSHESAVAQLIGAPGHSGQLANTLREHPYSLILLDEFEKAATGVHDLFLQILDEGEFTDGRGETVNMHTTILIATSNAGSSEIMSALEANTNLTEQTDTIIRSIISAGVYRPELINRFDGTIIFEPLQMSEQEQVARLLLTDVQERMQEQGYTITFAADVLTYIAETGYQPEFGARPMRRLIQDTVEERVAAAIIAGSLQKGGELTISAADLID